VDPRTEELRAAHDVLAEVYVARLAGILEQMPIERAVLGLFAELVHEGGTGTHVGDIGCGTGRLAPHLSALGLSPRGVDLSPEMIRVAQRDHPAHPFEVADLRALPFEDACLDGVTAWYSLMYLSPEDRGLAFAELARVLKPGGYLATAFKMGDDSLRRGGRSLDLGIAFDIYWLSRQEVESRLGDAGFAVVFWGDRPADPDELQPQGYLIARRLREHPARGDDRLERPGPAPTPGDRASRGDP
jgi:SAM-dependent methyltransferase